MRQIALPGGIEMKDFCKKYLAMQGVLIMPPARVASRQIQEREKEVVAKVNQYERD